MDVIAVVKSKVISMLAETLTRLAYYMKNHVPAFKASFIVSVFVNKLSRLYNYPVCRCD